MSDARWFRDLNVTPLSDTAQGTRISGYAVARLFLVAESLGGRPILVVQISQIVDSFPDGTSTTREGSVSIDYQDEALFEFYVDSTGDDEFYEVGSLPGENP